MSKGLNIRLNVIPKGNSIVDFEQVCRRERDKLQEIEKQYQAKFKKYIDKAKHGNSRAQ